MRITAATLLAAAGLAALAWPAAAPAQWEAPQRIDNPGQGEVSNPGVGVAGDGTAVAAFQQLGGSAAPAPERDVAFPYLTRRAGAATTWPAPQRPGGIPAVNEDGDAIGEARLAVAPAGLAGLFFPFADQATGKTGAYGSLWPAAEAAPGAATAFKEGIAELDATAFDVAGNLYVLTREPGTATGNPLAPAAPDGALFLTRLDAAGGAATTRDTNLAGRDARLAVSRSGTVVLSYLKEYPKAGTPLTGTRLTAARAALGGDFKSSERTLTEEDRPVAAGDHAVVVDDEGDATFVYAYQPEQAPPSQPLRRVVYGQAWRAGAAEPGGRTSLSKNETGTADARSPRAAADGDGRVTAAWVEGTGTRNDAFATERAGETWRDKARVTPESAGMRTDTPPSPQDPDGETDADVIALAVDRTGVATMLIPGSRDGSRDGVWASRRAAGGAWSAPVRVSSAAAKGDARKLAVAARPEGQADAVWTQDATVQAARFASPKAPSPPPPRDATPPAVTVSSPAFSTDAGPRASFAVDFEGRDESGSALSFNLQFRELSGRVRRRARKSASAFKTIPARRYAGKTEYLFRGLRGRTYEFRVRATDESGNRSPYVRTTTVVPLDDRSRGIAFGGGWAEARQGQAFRGAFRVSSREGASLELSFLGAGVALIAPTGPSGGRALVTFDGRQKLVDFYSAGGRDRVVVYRRAAKLRRHRLRLVVLHSRSRAARGFKVPVDAIGVARMRR